MARSILITCDRCKKVLPEKEYFFGVAAEQTTFTIFNNIELSFIKASYELCPDCMEKLEAFLSMEYENNEKS